MPNGRVLANYTHIGDGLSTLSAGVTLFFCLSGFLLYRQFAAPIARGASRLPVGAYLYNRVLRIAPAYWVILIVTALILATVNLREQSGQLGVGRLTDPLTFLQTALLVQQYHPGTLMSGIGPAWSLAVELTFYFLLPLLAVGVLGLARRVSDRRDRVRLLLGPPVLMLTIGLTGKAVAGLVISGTPGAGYSANWHSVIERSLWTQADLFSFGMAVAVLHVEVSDGRLTLPRHWRWMAVALALLVFIPCAATMHEAEHSYLPQNTGEALAIALAFAAIVIPDAARQRPLLVVRILESRPFFAVGLASYSLFLWHYPIIAWLREHGLTLNGGWGDLLINLLIIGCVAGALSALTYRCVEVPALRRKRSTRVSLTTGTEHVGGGEPAAALALVDSAAQLS